MGNVKRFEPHPIIECTMLIREEFQKREAGFLSPFGFHSANTRGRRRDERPCPIRTPFQQDRDRILFSNGFRRMKHKTQVFLAPLGDQYRTRMTHTLEVAQISRTIVRAMRLNEDLAEAIALAHDMGHTPFGHSGETTLKEIYSPHFTHTRQSLRVVDVLEKEGEGLNLTYEVRDGILKHSKGYGNIMPESRREKAVTYEGRVVRIADIMAYLNHDLDDAVRSGIITEKEIPEKCIRVLGKSHSQRLTTMIHDLIFTSTPKNGELTLDMTDKVFDAMTALRQFLYDHVYRSDQVHSEFEKSRKILTELYTYFLKDRESLLKEMAKLELGGCSQGGRTAHERCVCDFIAGLTDRQALELYSRLFFPVPVI